MPLLQSPLHSFQAQGQLAKLWAHKYRMRQHVVAQKPLPTDPNTLSQHHQRFTYTYWSRVWHYMTSSERSAYAVPRWKPKQAPYNYFLSTKLLTPLSPLMYLPLDVKATNDPYDTYKRGYQGLGYGCSTVPGRVDDALYYDGLDDYSILDLTLVAPTTLSISYWYKWASLFGVRYATYASPVVYTDSPFFHYLSGSADYIVFHTSSGTTNWGWAADLNWHHVALVYNGTSTTIYLDNAINGTQAQSGPAKDFLPWFYFARGYGVPSYFANISLDQFLFLPHAMSPQEIRAQYLSPHAISKELQP